jgi:hypothetical protein
MSGFVLTHDLSTGEMGRFDAPVVMACGLPNNPNRAGIAIGFDAKWINSPSCVGDDDPPVCICKPFGDNIINEIEQ